MTKSWTPFNGLGDTPSTGTNPVVFRAFLPRLNDAPDGGVFALIRPAALDQWITAGDFLLEIQKSYPEAILSSSRVSYEGTSTAYQAVLLHGDSARRFKADFEAKKGTTHQR